MRYFIMNPITTALLLFTGQSARSQGDYAELEWAIAKIEKLGGQVELEGKGPGKPVIKVDLSGSKVADADLEILKRLTQIRSLILRHLNITEAGTKHLKGLTALEFSIGSLKTYLALLTFTATT